MVLEPFTSPPDSRREVLIGSELAKKKQAGGNMKIKDPRNSESGYKDVEKVSS